MNASIEETIERVEQLYCALTGQRPPPPNGHTARIPPETDPGRHVEEQLAKLMTAIDGIAPSGTPLAVLAQPWTPRATSWRDETGWHLAIEVPGVAREAIELRLAGSALVVSGHRPPPWGDARAERRIGAAEGACGPLVRTFELAAHVDPAQITARLEAGVLHVHVARAALGEPSQVPIQS